MAASPPAPVVDRAPIGLIICLALFAATAITITVGVEYLLGLALIAGFASLALAAPRISIVALAAYAPLAAGFRRFLEFGLFSTSGLTAADLVMIPIPATTIVLCAMAIRRGALQNRSSAMNAMLVLIAIAAIGIVNPLQGSVAVGAIGFLYLGAPFLWFIIAKTFVDDVLLRRVLIAYVVVSVPIAVYAIAGGLDILFSWDRRFLEETNLIIIFVGGSARPLSTLASPEELGRFLAVTTLIAGTLVLMRCTSWIARSAALGLVLLLLTALAFSGMRAASILLVFGAGVIAAAWFGVRPLAAIAGGCLALLLLIGAARVAGAFGPTGYTFVDRQIAGLSAPWDARQSTLSEHIRVQQGIVARRLPDRPLGLGTGSTSPAAGRLGSRARITESDVGDAAIAWGFPGVAAYLAVVVLAVRSAFVVAWHRRDLLALAALGVIAAMLLRWTEGGLYALAPLVWMCFGWFDLTASQLSDRTDLDRSLR